MDPLKIKTYRLRIKPMVVFFNVYACPQKKSSIEAGGRRCGAVGSKRMMECF
jgi:hypothetical protein